MFQDGRLHVHMLHYRMYTDVNKGRLDLIVLRYMARSVHLIFPEEVVATTMPALSYSEERRGLIHRIAVYDPQGLQEQRNLAFVGFVSRKHQPLSASIVEDIHEADRQLLLESTSWYLGCSVTPHWNCAQATGTTWFCSITP